MLEICYFLYTVWRGYTMPDNDKRIPMCKDTIGYEAFGNLYLNITNQCSASCVFCLRHFSDGVYGYNLRLSREPSEEEILKELESLNLLQFKEVVFTGLGEPTCRFDVLLRSTEWLHKRGMPVRLDTNGHAALMHPGRDVVAELKTAGLDAVSVSLNAESEEKYNRLCRPVFEGSYGALLDFTKEAIKAGIRARMTVVWQPDIDIRECERIATGMGASFKMRGA
jgi:cyclic pyranopterin phosphate synthase